MRCMIESGRQNIFLSDPFRAFEKSFIVFVGSVWLFCAQVAEKTTQTALPISITGVSSVPCAALLTRLDCRVLLRLFAQNIL